MSEKITLKFTGGKDKMQKYSDGTNECVLSDPSSCVIVVDQQDAVNKLRDHGDKFVVVKNEDAILSMLENAKSEEEETNKILGAEAPVNESEVEEVEEVEEVPNNTWSKSKIQKWLKNNDTAYETKDTKADLLELVGIVLEDK